MDTGSVATDDGSVEEMRWARQRVAIPLAPHSGMTTAAIAGPGSPRGGNGAVVSHCATPPSPPPRAAVTNLDDFDSEDEFDDDDDDGDDDGDDEYGSLADLDEFAPTAAVEKAVSKAIAEVAEERYRKGGEARSEGEGGGGGLHLSQHPYASSSSSSPPPSPSPQRPQPRAQPTDGYSAYLSSERCQHPSEQSQRSSDRTLQGGIRTTPHGQLAQAETAIPAQQGQIAGQEGASISTEDRNGARAAAASGSGGGQGRGDLAAQAEMDIDAREQALDNGMFNVTMWTRLSELDARTLLRRSLSDGNGGGLGAGAHAVGAQGKVQGSEGDSASGVPVAVAAATAVLRGRDGKMKEDDGSNGGCGGASERLDRPPEPSTVKKEIGLTNAAALGGTVTATCGPSASQPMSATNSSRIITTGSNPIHTATQVKKSGDPVDITERCERRRHAQDPDADVEGIDSARVGGNATGNNHGTSVLPSKSSGAYTTNAAAAAAAAVNDYHAADGGGSRKRPLSALVGSQDSGMVGSVNRGGSGAGPGGDTTGVRVAKGESIDANSGVGSEGVEGGERAGKRRLGEQKQHQQQKQQLKAACGVGQHVRGETGAGRGRGGRYWWYCGLIDGVDIMSYQFAVCIGVVATMLFVALPVLGCCLSLCIFRVCITLIDAAIELPNISFCSNTSFWF